MTSKMQQRLDQLESIVSSSGVVSVEVQLQGVVAIRVAAVQRHGFLAGLMVSMDRVRGHIGLRVQWIIKQFSI